MRETKTLIPYLTMLKNPYKNIHFHWKKFGKVRRLRVSKVKVGEMFTLHKLLKISFHKTKHKIKTTTVKAGFWAMLYKKPRCVFHADGSQVVSFLFHLLFRKQNWLKFPKISMSDKSLLWLIRSDLTSIASQVGWISPNVVHLITKNIFGVLCLKFPKYLAKIWL